MVKIKHRISACLLSCLLCFGTVSSDYLEVQAFEWIAPAIGIEEALKALLMLLGITVGVKGASEVDWGTLKEDCIQHQIEMGNSQVEVSRWWANIIDGSLDQASDCWSAFKSWAKSLYYDNFENTLSSFSVLESLLGVDMSGYSELLNIDFNMAYYATNGNGQITEVHFLNNISSCEFSADASTLIVHVSDGLKCTKANFVIYVNNGAYSIRSTSTNTFSNQNSLNVSGSFDYYFFGTGLIVNSYKSNFYDWTINKFMVNAYNPAIVDALTLALQNAISTAIPGVIPLPWENLGDNVQAINEQLDKLIELVNEGVLSISDAMLKIQALLNVLAIDVAGVLVPTIPNPDTGEPEKLEDKAKENQENQGFTLFGLEKVFPFCIPFDIYAFMTLLVAEPVAPVIRWPVYNPVTHDNEIITIDFSTWQSVVTLFRYIFDFLFILGMLLMARALIGGGDSA